MPGLLLQPHPVPHAEFLGHLARQLDPAGPVQHRVLAGVVGAGLTAGIYLAFAGSLAGLLAGVVAVITGSYLGTVRLAAGTGSNW